VTAPVPAAVRDRNFFAVAHGNARRVVPIKLEQILRSESFQRGYADRAAGLPRLKMAQGNGAELNYERGRMFAAAIMGHGLAPAPILEDGDLVEGVTDFALAFADDWDPINTILAQWRPGEAQNGDAK